MNLRRVGLIIAAIVLVETVAFVVVNRDLVYLSQPMSRLRAEPQEGFRAMAERALARDRVARRHLERMAEVTAANGDADLRLEALRRLAKDFSTDRSVWLRLGDALRLAKRYDEADAAYRRLLGAGR